MPVGVASGLAKATLGTCPHGMAPGACPICSGMAGGNSTTKRDTPRNVGEMTYNQCAAIGAMLRAQKAAHQRAEIAQQNHIQVLQNIQKSMESAHQRIMDLAANISRALPAVISAPVNFVLVQVVARVINIAANVTGMIANAAQKLADISDKLAAVYGELKASVSKALSNLSSGIKKKLKTLLFVFGSDDEDEEKRIEEAQKAFNLKTFLQDISRKFKREEERVVIENDN